MSKRQYVKHRVTWFFLAVSLTVVTCSGLAWWQFQRGQAKAQLVLQKNQLLTAHEFLDTQLDVVHGMSVQLDGDWLSEFYWLLDNQIVNGQAGYDLLAPYRLASGSILIINLGFLAASAPRLPPKTRPDIALLPKIVEVTIKTKNLKGFSLATSPEQSDNVSNLIQYIDPAYFAKALGTDVIDAVGYANQAYSPELTHHFSLSVMPAQKHYAYALQWLLLAIAAAVVAYFKFRTEQRSVADEK